MHKSISLLAGSLLLTAMLPQPVQAQNLVTAQPIILYDNPKGSPQRQDTAFLLTLKLSQNSTKLQVLTCYIHNPHHSPPWIPVQAVQIKYSPIPKNHGSTHLDSLTKAITDYYLDGLIPPSIP